MWKKLLIIALVFYALALLQNAFFIHFRILGAVPDLVFIFFILLVFFSAPGGPASGWQVFFYAIMAGLILDIFSFTYICPSIFILAITAFLLKKAQALLKNRQESRPLVYFLPLFLLFFCVWQFLNATYLSFFGLPPRFQEISLRFTVQLIYDLAVAYVGFLVFKKLLNVQKVQG